jgi:hypothetical protein
LLQQDKSKVEAVTVQFLRRIFGTRRGEKGVGEKIRYTVFNFGVRAA